MKELLNLARIGIAFLGVAAAGKAQTLLTFDDLPTNPPPDELAVVITNGYGGLDWSNFGVVDGLEIQPTYGYYTGVVSPPNVAFNEYGDPASISISHGVFDLDSAYLTAALNLGTPLNIQVQGFLGTTLIYSNTYTVNDSGPTLIKFNYDGIDRVTFTSFPAQPFAMDNLTVMVPEPSGLPVVTVQATQPIATPNHPGVFTVFRAGNTNATLNAWYDLGGTASNGVDYALISPHMVAIPAGVTSTNIVITPLTNPPAAVPFKTVVLTLTNSPLLTPVNYEIGSPSRAVVCIRGTNYPPLFAISVPKDGTVFYTPTNILISANVDYQFYPLYPFPTNVEFFAGTNYLGRGVLCPWLTIPEVAAFCLTWTNVPPGNYPLTAMATDIGGIALTSAPVNITVLQGPPPALPPMVTISASAPLLFAAPTTNNTGTFTVFRHGNTNMALNVFYDIGGTASNGVDYAPIGNWVGIPAGATSNTITITPIPSSPSNIVKSVVLRLAPSPLADPVEFYTIGSPSNAALYLADNKVFGSAPVAISSPPNGAMFYTPTNIEIWAWTYYGTRVEFFAGTNDLGIGTGVPTFTMPDACVLIWSNPPPGDYALTVVAEGASGSLTSAPVSITVLQGQPTNLPPVAEIFSPTNGQVFALPPTNVQTLIAPTVPLFATASDVDGHVTNVEFFANGRDLGKGIQRVLDPPGINGVTGLIWFLSWSSPPAGDYTLTAIATDDGGASATSASVNISVVIPPSTNLPPIVRVISPANGALFRAPINIPLYAYARTSDSGTNWLLDQVTNLEFYADGTDLGSAKHVVYSPPMGPGPYPLYIVILPHDFFLTWSNAPVGQHRLTAVAEDPFGNSATSAPVNITVLSSLPPPTNRPPVVSIVATDPVAIEGTNAWIWRGETNSSPTWAAWPTAVCRFFTNSGPKTATFTVRRFGDTNNDLTVTYNIGGTASNGVDYVTLPGSVTIPAGGRRALISIVPIDDGPPDVNKTVILTLLPDMQMNPLPGYVLGFPRRAAAIILDPGPRPVGGSLVGRCFHFNEPGPDAAWFCIEYSTNLTDWTPVCTNQVINGSIDFVDPGSPSNPTRFYRAVPLTNPPSE